MLKALQELRQDYFLEICKVIPKFEGCLIILTHLLQDRPELINTLNKIAPVSLIIGIPYSVHEPTRQHLQQSFNVISPSLNELADADYLEKVIKQASLGRDFIILEIGGYFASVIQKIQQSLPDKLIGVIEDTEIGHRAYEKQVDLPCPVVSVARSPLKDPEDFLVGSSCLYSTEKIVRNMGFPVEGKQSLVLGFGKIGRGLSHALSRRNSPVSIFDKNPLLRISALSEGFRVPDRNFALQEAEVIYGATGSTSLIGDDFRLLRNGCLLVSCSSKKIEFDLPFLQENYTCINVFDGLDQYYNEDQVFYLLAGGAPVNFIDGGVIGPVLALVQAEIVIAIKMLMDLKGEKGLFEVNSTYRTYLAQEWINYFCDLERGSYFLKQPCNKVLAFE